MSTWIEYTLFLSFLLVLSMLCFFSPCLLGLSIVFFLFLLSKVSFVFFFIDGLRERVESREWMGQGGSRGVDGLGG